MAENFIAHPPGTQNPDTYRQFVELEQATQRIQQQLDFLLFDFIIPNFTFAAHGTMFNQTPVTGPDIGTGWQDVTSFDSVAAANRITFNTTDNTWTYQNSGVYQVSLALVLKHDESNSGRSFEVRLQDGNNTAPGVPVAVGRNQPGSNLAISFLQDITVGDTNRTFSLEVGNGDAIGSVVWEAAGVTVTNVGAWVDEVPRT